MEARAARTAWAEEEPSEQATVARTQARRHLREVLEENFARWVLVFSLVLCLMIPSMLTLFMWMLVSLVRDFKAECDAPLQLWVIVVCINVTYHVNWCGAGSVHSMILKKFNAESAEVMPQHVTCYNLMVTLMIFDIVHQQYGTMAAGHAELEGLPACDVLRTFPADWHLATLLAKPDATLPSPGRFLHAGVAVEA
eukprot:s118_g11.t1